jgi:hypothetical protein
LHEILTVAIVRQPRGCREAGAIPALSRNCDASSGAQSGRRPERISSDVPEEGQMAFANATLIVSTPLTSGLLS